MAHLCHASREEEYRQSAISKRRRRDLSGRSERFRPCDRAKAVRDMVLGNAGNGAAQKHPERLGPQRLHRSRDPRRAGGVRRALIATLLFVIGSIAVLAVPATAGASPVMTWSVTSDG